MAHHLLASIRNDFTRSHLVSSFRAKYPGKETGLRETLEVLHCYGHVQSNARLPSPRVSQCLFCSKHHLPVLELYLGRLTNKQQCLTCGLLATFQYTILTSARSIFNPRFNLTSPLISGLFYLSPGIGFLVGSVVGGKLSDRAVKKWIIKRNGVRLPQDRLNSGIATLFGVLPVATLIYGWTLEEEVGGMVVPIIAAFFAGVGLMGSFNGLNTYTAGECYHFHMQVSRAYHISCRGYTACSFGGHQRKVCSAVYLCCRGDGGR